MTEFSIDTALDQAEAKPASRRAILLREAERLFAERGYKGVTVRDVTEAASVNVATLHLHWQSKATLYEAVCRRHARYLTTFLEQAAGTAEDLSPAERVVDLVDHIFDLLLKRPAVAPMALETFSGQAPPSLPTLFQHDIATFRIVADEIAKLMPPGRDRDADPMLSLLAAFYFAVVAFSDSPLQQALLGGSVYRSPALQAQLKKFGRLAFAELIAPSAATP